MHLIEFMRFTHDGRVTKIRTGAVGSCIRVCLASWVKCEVKWQAHLVLAVVALVVALLSSCHQGSPLQGDHRHLPWSPAVRNNVHTHVTYAPSSNFSNMSVMCKSREFS